MFATVFHTAVNTAESTINL